MFNRTFYNLQAKKALWFTTMLTVTGFTLINTTLAPITILGLSLGIGTFHLLSLLPTIGMSLVLLTAPFIALFTPVALTFNLGFLGILAHRIMGKSKIDEAFQKTHTMGEAEDLDLMSKLEKKTNVYVSKKEVCDIDPKKLPPNASAVGGFANNTIYVFSNLMKSPFTRKEKKAVYAHEFGHLKHWDFLTKLATSFLWYTTIAGSLLSFNLPIAIAISSVASLSYYAVSQIDELLADCYSAQHSNPEALMSALQKLVDYKTEKSGAKQSLWSKTKSSLHSFQNKIGMSTHPSCEIRKSYLASYAEEKQAAKEEYLRTTASPGL